MYIFFMIREDLKKHLQMIQKSTPRLDSVLRIDHEAVEMRGRLQQREGLGRAGLEPQHQPLGGREVLSAGHVHGACGGVWGGVFYVCI